MQPVAVAGWGSTCDRGAINRHGQGLSPQITQLELPIFALAIDCCSALLLPVSHALLGLLKGSAHHRFISFKELFFPGSGHKCIHVVAAAKHVWSLTAAARNLQETAGVQLLPSLTRSSSSVHHVHELSLLNSLNIMQDFLFLSCTV